MSSEVRVRTGRRGQTLGTTAGLWALLVACALLAGAPSPAYAQGPLLDSITRWWSFHKFDGGAVIEQRLGPERVQVGGIVDETYDHGPLSLHPPGEGPNAKGHVFSNQGGGTYWVSTQAPGGRLSLGEPIGNASRLVQYQYFRKTDANAQLQLVVTQATMEGIDANAGVPTPEECPWHVEGASYSDCRRMMSAHVWFQVNAFSFFDQTTFLRTGGSAEIVGWRGVWDYAARTAHDATVPFWNRASFIFEPDLDESGGGHALLKLAGNVTIDVPLSSVQVGDMFYLSVSAKASTYNRRQKESYLSARLRDPVQAGGLEFSFTGLEPIETPVEKPALVAPTPAPACGGEPDRGAGRLHFKGTAYIAPELPGEGATILVKRSGGRRGAVSATFTTTDGSAIAGVDYAPVTTHVLFADGEAGTRAVQVPILADGLAESNKTVTLTLSDPMGCARLGRRTSAVLTILDDDRPIEEPPTFTVGGTVTGLVGTGLVLSEVVTGDEAAPAVGAFSFDYPFASGDSYDVRVASQPTGPVQVCTVSNGTGMVGAADVTDVTVDCVTPLPNGALDPGFGSDGKVTVGMAGGASAMALQADGKVVLVGGKTLARYHTDGALDESFGAGGQVAIAFNGGLSDAVQGVAVQPDGKIVAVGFTRVGLRDDFAVARYNVDGSADAGFGTGGWVSTDFSGSVDKAWTVLVQPDGSLVVGGHAATSSALGLDNDFALARYTAAGALDAGFGSGGKVTTNVAGRTDLAYAAALQPDGKIVLAGRVADGGGDNPDVGLVRYNTNGSVDTSFNAGGVVDADLSGDWDEASDLVLQPDGKIVVAVQAFIGGAFTFAVARFDASGELDLGFGNAGVATTSFAGLGDFPRAVALQTDGKIVVAGYSSTLTDSDVAVARHDATGSLDTTFGTGGKVTVDFFGSTDGAECAAIQMDGKIVVGGVARNGTTTGLALTRLVP